MGRDLAANIGIRFYTPEEYFLGAEPEPFTREFEPTKFLGDPLCRTLDIPTNIEYEKINPQDMLSSESRLVRPRATSPNSSFGSRFMA